MKRTVTSSQIATIFGVKDRTVRWWAGEGCPHTRRSGRLLFNEAEVRDWRAGHPSGPEGGSPSPPRGGPSGAPLASRESLAKAELARRLTIARKNELELAAERGLKDLDLSDQIRAAQTNQDLAAMSKEVGALLGSGTLSPSRGRAIQALLAEARHNMKEHREVEGDDDPQHLRLINEEDAALLDAFQWIVADERRARILELASSEAEADKDEHPHVDTALEVEAEAEAGDHEQPDFGTDQEEEEA